MRLLLREFAYFAAVLLLSFVLSSTLLIAPHRFDWVPHEYGF